MYAAKVPPDCSVLSVADREEPPRRNPQVCRR